MSISNFFNKIKGKIDIDKFSFLYLIIIICVGISCFCLGRISTNIFDDGSNDDILYGNSYNSYTDDDSRGDVNAINTSTEKKYVASKNGKMYYSLGCSGAKRIKPENEIWFSSKEEAEKSGYELSSLCK